MKALIGCLLFVPLVCSAQIYQCKDSAGKVTLQQTPCSVGASGKMVAAPPAQQQTAPQQQNPEARQLTALISVLPGMLSSGQLGNVILQCSEQQICCSCRVRFRNAVQPLLQLRCVRLRIPRISSSRSTR